MTERPGEAGVGDQRTPGDRGRRLVSGAVLNGAVLGFLVALVFSSPLS